MICISHSISEADLASIISLINDENNQDGALTAGYDAQKIKNNIQQFSGEALAYAQNIVTDFFNRSAIIQNYAFPIKYSALRLIRYQAGMYYGKHCDNVIQNNMRTDISFTIFLSDPKDYEGGDLRIYNYNNFQDIKLEAGSMVLYPSHSLHEITPVTAGERLVLVGWIQSTIQDPQIRDILYGMATLRDQLQKYQNTELHQKAIHNFNRLYRLYAQV